MVEDYAIAVEPSEPVQPQPAKVTPSRGEGDALEVGGEGSATILLDVLFRTDTRQERAWDR